MDVETGQGSKNLGYSHRNRFRDKFNCNSLVSSDVYSRVKVTIMNDIIYKLRRTLHERMSYFIASRAK